MLRMADTILTFSDYAQGDVRRYVQPRRFLTAYPGMMSEKFHPPEDGGRDVWW